MQNGSVTVNGNPITEVPFFITGDERIAIRGKQLPNSKDGITNPTKLYKFYKPRGYLVTNHDPENRKNIFDIIPKSIGRLISIGRLDMHSEGLILMTNNPKLAHFMELPHNKIEREYEVDIIHTERKMPHIQNSVVIGDQKYNIKCWVILHSDKMHKRIAITLTEGRNREIRNIMAFLNVKVTKLIRVRYDDIKIDDLKIGAIREVSIDNSLFTRFTRFQDNIDCYSHHSR